MAGMTGWLVIIGVTLLMVISWHLPSFRGRLHRSRRRRCRKGACRYCRIAQRLAGDNQVLTALNRELDEQFGPGYADRFLVDFHAGSGQ